MNKNIYDLKQIKKEKSINNKSKNKYKNKKNKIIILMVILIIFILLGTIISKKHVNMMETRYGEMVDGFNTKALIIRDETLFSASTSGKVRLLQKEGDRVGYGDEIIKLGDNIFYNQIPGVVSYASDSLENILFPDDLNNISVKEYENLKREFSQIVDGDHLFRGETAFRIVNNFELFLMIEIPISKSKRFHKQELVFVESQNINTNLIKGRIKNIFFKGDKVLMVISLNRFIDEWLNIRWVKIKLIKDIYRGIIIPRKAVFIQESGKGVITCSSTGEYRFKKIKIEDGTEKNVVVSGLDIGERIVINPEAINYGKGGK